MIARLRVDESTWLWWIVLIWLLVVSYANYDRALPASYWFSVESVHVADAAIGEDPQMVVSRTIKRPFRAKWIAEVERWNGSKFVVSQRCVGLGENNYFPENKLPDPLTLDWWLYPTKCVLNPGKYRAETRWNLSNGNGIRAVSNVFSVNPREEDP